MSARNRRRSQGDIEDAIGTMMTAVDCPFCEAVFDVEGDAEGDVVTCPDCQGKMRVRRL